MTTRQLAAHGRRFMRLLGMSEWVRAAVFRVKRLDGLCGNSEWHAEERRCWIAVAPDDDAVMLETLLHEILHICLEGHQPEIEGAVEYDADYELALNRIAKALREAWS